jgi:hypothetical protein
MDHPRAWPLSVLAIAMMACTPDLPAPAGSPSAIRASFAIEFGPTSGRVTVDVPDRRVCYRNAAVIVHNDHPYIAASSDARPEDAILRFPIAVVSPASGCAERVTTWILLEILQNPADYYLVFRSGASGETIASRLQPRETS